MSERETLRKLNIGCGDQRLPGFVNLDKVDAEGIDILYDLDQASYQQMKYRDLAHVPDNSFDRMLMSHVFEHLNNVLPAMEELWRVAKPGCSLVIMTPYGSSDNADEDPTHVRRVFKNTFEYFGQCYYGAADYGYRGDWDVRQKIFTIDGSLFGPEAEDQQIGMAVGTMRNVVVEFTAELRAVKPIRARGSKPERDPVVSWRFAAGSSDATQIIVPGAGRG
jgi:SAM-dependent methyltransferase